MREKLKAQLERLEEMKKTKLAHCDTWRDSGDRGACYAYEVSPIISQIHAIQAQLEELERGEK